MKVTKALFLFGPTAVGKSVISEQVAQKLGFELINMDSGSFLTPLFIGTAKPDIEKYAVKCHLFNILDKPEEFSVVDYRERVVETLQDMNKRKVHPVFVGGSAFYLKSLFFPPVSDLGRRNRAAVKQIFSRRQLWNLLKKVDPIRAATINPGDLYRIERALYLWTETEQKPSDFAPQYEPLFKKSIVVFLERDRQELYERINSRVDYMVREGFFYEALVAYQDPLWRDYLQWKKLIGYVEWFDYLRGKDASDKAYKQAIEKIKQRTRNYAKRQITFWRMLKKELSTVTTKGKRIVVKEINLSKIPASDHVEKIVSLM